MNVVCQSCLPRGGQEAEIERKVQGQGLLFISSLTYFLHEAPAMSSSVSQSTDRKFEYVKKKSGHGPGRYFMNRAKVHQLSIENLVVGSKGLTCFCYA